MHCCTSRWAVIAKQVFIWHSVYILHRNAHKLHPIALCQKIPNDLPWLADWPDRAVDSLWVFRNFQFAFALLRDAPNPAWTPLRGSSDRWPSVIPALAATISCATTASQWAHSVGDRGNGETMRARVVSGWWRVNCARRMIHISSRHTCAWVCVRGFIVVVVVVQICWKYEEKERENVCKQFGVWPTIKKIQFFFKWSLSIEDVDLYLFWHKGWTFLRLQECTLTNTIPAFSSKCNKHSALTKQYYTDTKREHNVVV